MFDFSSFILMFDNYLPHNFFQEETIPSILSYYAAATEYDSQWYKAWHAWAVMNFETCLFYRQQPGAGGKPQDPTQDVKTSLSPLFISNYAVPALKGKLSINSFIIIFTEN